MLEKIIAAIVMFSIIMIVYYAYKKHNDKMELFNSMKPGDTLYFFSQELSDKFGRQIYLPATFTEYTTKKYGDDFRMYAKLSYFDAERNEHIVECDDSYVKHDLLLINKK